MKCLESYKCIHCNHEGLTSGLSNSNHKAPPRPFFHRFVGSGEARADKPTSFLGGMVMPTRRAGRELESPAQEAASGLHKQQACDILKKTRRSQWKSCVSL